MSSARRIEKIQRFKKIAKNRRLCFICLKRNAGKNMFARARRGTC